MVLNMKQAQRKRGAVKTLVDIRQQILSSLVQAPSAHNTQPWKVALRGNALDIYIDWDRHLLVSDPTERQTHVSVGCAIETAVVAGAGHALDAEVEYFPEGQGLNKPVARIAFTRMREARRNLFNAIIDRRTNRHIFDGEKLTEKEKRVLPTLKSKFVIALEDQVSKEVIANASAEGTEKTLSKSDFKNELSHWVRNSWTGQHDGMPGYAMGMPAAVSFIAPLLVRIAPIHTQEAPKVKQQVLTASTVAVIASPHDTKEEWMESGRILQRLWLEATAAGLAASPVTAAIEAGGGTRKAIKDATKSSLLPQAILRIGHNSDALRASPRRTIEEILLR